MVLGNLNVDYNKYLDKDTHVNFLELDRRVVGRQSGINISQILSVSPIVNNRDPNDNKKYLEILFISNSESYTTLIIPPKIHPYKTYSAALVRLITTAVNNQYSIDWDLWVNDFELTNPIN